jgi:hypothetical protein
MPPMPMSNGAEKIEGVEVVSIPASLILPMMVMSKFIYFS